MSAIPHKHLAQLMTEVVAFSANHVEAGGIPFSAFVIDGDGEILGRGVNRVRDHCDPTAHAEVDAIRNACHSQGRFYLPGKILLASGEPCAMCYMSALYAGISHIFFAVDRDEAAIYGFDYRGTYDLFASDPHNWRAPLVSKLAVPEGLKPFHTFCGRRHTSS